MQRRAMLAVAAVLATAALSPAAPASAAERANVDFQAVAVENVPVRATPTSAGTYLVNGAGRSALALDDETMQDLATYANQSGQDLAAVAKAHEGIHEFSAYVAQLEQTRPDTFVRAGLATAGKAGSNWIQFTAKPSADIDAELARLPVATEVRYGAPASSKELAELAYSLTTSLAARRGAIRSAGTTYDHERHVLRLRYAPASGVQPTTLRSVFQEALTAGTVGGQLPLGVVLELDVDGPAVTETVVQGGRDLYNANDGFVCTAGFTASRGGSRGLLTAKHCPNGIKYGFASGVISTVPVQATGPNDLQWHRTLTENDHSTNAQFRATSREASGDRTVTAVGNGPIGSVACHWGKVSTYRCTTIADTDHCYIMSGTNTCGLDKTADDVSAGGDSGGPWFFGNTARGIHAGGQDGVASYFTRISRVSYLDATVLQD